ncbi:hypothetical protein TSAR_008847 [Trichomalopsis sarcophagae]|uniref:RRM domain-containing protein n=1 Tax=Trichomalopsis sarcophagae TaxID=543379 RepID=A0A232FK74_9HYME|nr:hypothetical protein TSAR_008847 [Trichomalopsis sarcophagae]
MRCGEESERSNKCASADGFDIGFSIMNNNSVEKPDPDNIKMFVGQVPKDLDENDLRTIFEEFGRVHQINVLRDKYTGSSKGKRPLLLA